MDKTKKTAGKSTATTPQPLTADEKIAKALHDIEVLNEQIKARQEAQDKREAELNKREAELKNTPAITKEEVEAYKTKAQKMKEFLWSQPLVTIMIPLEQGEKEGTTLPITLNGYRLNLRKNTYVEVPKPIADLLKDILKQNEAAGRDFRIDVPRISKEGVSVEEALM